MLNGICSFSYCSLTARRRSTPKKTPPVKRFTSIIAHYSHPICILQSKLFYVFSSVKKDGNRIAAAKIDSGLLTFLRPIYSHSEPLNNYSTFQFDGLQHRRQKNNGENIPNQQPKSGFLFVFSKYLPSTPYHYKVIFTLQLVTNGGQPVLAAV
jgi:hypothetical protein